ncbi:bifunctional phosphoribosylaminoimidazole carboxylase/phosphoribosylaminoimidazole succinocarboxamide synthetase-like isoform X2 [Leptinotarsa decemlineata]
MVDKQVYRNLSNVTDKDLDIVKRNFEWVADQLDHLIPPNNCLIVIVMGSTADKEHCNKIKNCLARRLNGLEPVISGNTDYPVMNCPPGPKDEQARDIWSSLNVSFGLECGTLLYPETAALFATQSIAINNYMFWSKLRLKRLGFFKSLPNTDEDEITPRNISQCGIYICEILVADVIDSNSWRLWPSGNKRLMVDKQVYRNLSTVSHKDLDIVKRNFEWVADQLDHLIPPNNCLIVIVMGSTADKEHCNEIKNCCEDLGLNTEFKVSSAYKTTGHTLDIINYYEGLNIPIIFIAVARRLNGLGPVISGNKDELARDIWSSLNASSGLGCGTLLYPETATVWSKLRLKRLRFFTSLPNSDEEMRNSKQ